MTRAINRLFILALLGFSTNIYAADELAVFVFKDGNAAAGLTAKLDGTVTKTVGEDGSVFFDLGAGSHLVSIFDGSGEVLASEGFSSAQGQYVDMSILIQWGEEPKRTLDAYFQTESPSERSKAATGGLLGRITAGNAPLEGATVKVNGTQTTTDDFGNYSIEVPRGLYTLTIIDPDIGEHSIENVRVVANIDRGASFNIGGDSDAAAAGAAAGVGVGASQLATAGPDVEEVFVVAKYRPEALGESERYSTNVVDTLGIGELSRFGDTDVAASVIRIPSVTVKDGRFIFIRGLGGRYITTTLNGSTLPSTDPTKRTVPLDLFPTNFVNQLDVNKTFTADMPGESTGGNLVINTRTYPAEAEGKLSVEMGYTQDLTFDRVWADSSSGDYDWVGYDDGTRGNRGNTFKGISNAQDYAPPGAQAPLGRTGALLATDQIDVGRDTANPKYGIGLSYGDVFDINDSEFGFFLAGNYKNEWTQRIDGIERTYAGSKADGTYEVADDFDFQEFDNKIDANGLLSLGLTAGNSTYSSTSLISRVTDSRTKVKAGLDDDSGFLSKRSTVDWVERSFISQQFTGNHLFGENENWIADWQFTYSRAERDAPDRREVRYDLEGGDGIYNLQVPDVVRRFDDLTDNNYDTSGDIEYMFDTDGDIETVLSSGLQYITRDRDSDSNSYGFDGGQNFPNDVTNAPNLKVGDVVNESTITGDASTGYTFQDKTLDSDSYDADLDLYAGYVSLDTLINAEYQFVVGTRYEDFQQTTNTFTLQGSGEKVRSDIDEQEWLPTGAFNWFFTDNQTLRFAASKTVSRPDFKETANATFYDPQFDFRVRGNPNLDTSTALNLDARYQYYWNDVDSWSVATFYKDIDNPIERVVQPASGTVGNSRTFRNADSADVWGIEFEGRKEFPIGESLTKTWFLSGNYSWIDSTVKFGTDDDRELQGQPEYVFNLVLGYDDIENNQEVTLLLNQNGDTIVDVGVSQQPDVKLEPRLELDLNYKWYFADDWQFVFKGNNLLDDDVEFTQGGETFQKYRTGREFTVGLNWNF